MAGAADRARRLGGEAARLRDRAALARARGDKNLADSLLDVARRQARQANKLRKQAKASGEIKTSAGGEAFDKRRRAAMRRMAEARRAGDTRAEAAHKADVEMYSKLAVQAYRDDGVRNRRVVKDEGNFAAEVAAAQAKKAEAKRKREAREAAKEAARNSPEARAKQLERDARRELWAKKREFWKKRRDEQARRLAVMRRSQRNPADQFVLAQQMVARERARVTRYFKKLDKELDEEFEKRAEAKKAASLRGRAKAAIKGAAGRIADRVSATRRKIKQENADEAKAQTELSEAKKAAKKLRATLASERKKLKVIRAAYSYQPEGGGHVATAAQARAAAAIQAQEAKVRGARTAAHLGTADDERRTAELTRALQTEQAKYDAVKSAGPAATKIRRAKLREAREALRAHTEAARLRAQSYREALHAEQEELKKVRAANVADPTPSGRAVARAAIADQVARVKAAREAVKENAHKGTSAKAKLAEIEATREARHKGSLAYKLGAPVRAVKGAAAKVGQRFSVALMSFKVKHGIDKPLLPWQRRTVMQKIFGSDKDYKGVTYHAKGLLGMGDAAVLGRRGQQGVHPEDVDVASKTPYVLHKGKKGGVYYIGPKGKKVYISHGGVFGFIKAFKSGLGGHRLLR